MIAAKSYVVGGIIKVMPSDLLGIYQRKCCTRCNSAANITGHHHAFLPIHSEKPSSAFRANMINRHQGDNIIELSMRGNGFIPGYIIRCDTYKTGHTGWSQSAMYRYKPNFSCLHSLGSVRRQSPHRGAPKCDRLPETHCRS